MVDLFVTRFRTVRTRVRNKKNNNKKLDRTRISQSRHLLWLRSNGTRDDYMMKELHNRKVECGTFLMVKMLIAQEA